MKNVVVSLGGSILVPEEGKINLEVVDGFKRLVSNFSDLRFIIVIGGGKVSRMYTDHAKKVGCSDNDLHWIGIMATRLNAELFRASFGEKAYSSVVYNPKKRIKTDKLIVAAGYKPGFSTDNDAVLLAKTYGAECVINLTNVDYVYDKNPKENSDAKPFKTILWKDMKRMMGNKWTPNANAPFDPIASKNASKFNLKVIVMNGNDLSNIENYLFGREFKGTVISNN